jgi:hypothetical protein
MRYMPKIYKKVIKILDFMLAELRLKVKTADVRMTLVVRENGNIIIFLKQPWLRDGICI